MKNETFTPERIKAEADAFFEWDGEDRSLVTTTSCLLFAQHIAGLMQARAAQPAPVVPEGSIYVECRQCDKCQHVGINDAAHGLAACHDCDWSGNEPEDDKCPGCKSENCMAAACPECGARYALIASEDVAAAPAQGQQVECQECGRLRSEIEVVTAQRDAAQTSIGGLQVIIEDQEAELAAQSVPAGEREAIYMMRRTDETAWHVTTFQTFEHIASGKSPQHEAVRLYTAATAQPAVQGEFGDAYQGAREDLYIWKRRALEAEARVRQQDQIIDQMGEDLNAINGPTFMGEPVLPAAPAPAQDVAEDWSVFIGYLIDKCEGHEISEERLQFWLRDMLDDPHYGALFRREKELAAQPAPVVPEGWRVFLSTADCLRDGDRWEVYGPKGGGIVSTHDVRDWAVRELLDALAAAPAQGQQVEPLYITHRPLIRNAISLLGMRRPVAPDVERVIEGLETMLEGMPAPAEPVSERWLGIAQQVEQEPVYLFRRKGQPEFCTCDRERYDELSGHALFETRILYDLPAAPTQGGDV